MAGDGSTSPVTYSRNGAPPSATRSGRDFPSKACTYQVVSYVLRSIDACSARNATYRPLDEITGLLKSVTSSKRRGEIVSACRNPTTAAPSTINANAEAQRVGESLVEETRRTPSAQLPPGPVDKKRLM